MHDPYSQIFEILPFTDSRGDRRALAHVWHKDPCTDGTDDSCGMFMRSRHGDKETLGKISREFKWRCDHNYWHDEGGNMRFSMSGTILLLYREALWIHYKRDRRKIDRYLRKHLSDVLTMAEHPMDSIGEDIKDMAVMPLNTTARLASIIYGDILRSTRPWWRHPRWHVHHWRFTFRWWQIK